MPAYYVQLSDQQVIKTYLLCMWCSILRHESMCEEWEVQYL